MDWENSPDGLLGKLIDRWTTELEKRGISSVRITDGNVARVMWFLETFVTEPTLEKIQRLKPRQIVDAFEALGDLPDKNDLWKVVRRFFVFAAGNGAISANPVQRDRHPGWKRSPMRGSESLEQVFDQWLLSLKKAGARDRNLQDHRGHILKLLMTALLPLHAEELPKLTLHNVQDYFLENPLKNPSNRASLWLILSRFFDFVVENNIMPENPLDGSRPWFVTLSSVPEMSEPVSAEVRKSEVEVSAPAWVSCGADPHPEEQALPDQTTADKPDAIPILPESSPTEPETSTPPRSDFAGSPPIGP